MKLFKKCYSTNGEDFHHLEFNEALDDLLNNLEDCFLVPGQELKIYEADAVEFVPSDFVTEHRVQNFLEDMACAAADEAGEYAEDFDYCTQEAYDELKTLLSEWADRSLTAAFYGVRNDREIEVILTQEMIDEVVGNVI